MDPNEKGTLSTDPREEQDLVIAETGIFHQNLKVWKTIAKMYNDTLMTNFYIMETVHLV